MDTKDKHVIGVFTDKFMADPDMYQDDSYCEFQKVDMNGGYVEEKGADSEILEKTEDNVRFRFNLEPKED